MKKSFIPEVHVDSWLLADLEAVLRDGESLSEFVEAAVRRAVDVRRRLERDFQFRGEAAWPDVVARVTHRREERWLADNLDALESSNEFVERLGLPLGKYKAI